MPLKSARRLPKKFNRPASKKTRALVDRRRSQHKQWQRERWRRIHRRVQRLYADWQRFAVRWTLVSIMAALALVFGLLAFSPIVQVREMRVVRNNPRLDIEHVQQVLSPLFNRHLLFLSKFEVLALLQEQIPDLDTVSVQKSYPSELIVRITLDPLIANLDIRAPDEVPGSSTGAQATYDFLTSEGMYVATAVPQAAAEDLPEIQVVDWGARPSPGSVLISLALLEQMHEADDRLLTQFGHVVRKRIVHLRAQEYHLQLDTYSLWFDLRSTVEEQLQRYRTFLQATGTEGVTEYIDLRLKDQVVFR